MFYIGGVFSDSVTTQSTFAAFKTHFGYTFTIPNDSRVGPVVDNQQEGK